MLLRRLTEFGLGEVSVTAGEGLSYKYEKTKELLRKHSNERIIIFFDYDLRKKDSLIEESRIVGKKTPTVYFLLPPLPLQATPKPTQVKEIPNK